ncbi:MAG: protein translocase subunit SecDF [Bacteroidetes bacterium]|nr:MAG: protein translocase subunit SecDF [Bacteroidota bacterium]
MKNQGVVKVFTILLALVCLFHISFTFVARGIEGDAQEHAESLAANFNGDDDAKAKFIQESKRKYLDSVSGQTAYNIILTKYNYTQVKEHELNLGLDLQGGMNVTLEVSLPEFIRALANKTEDKNFNKAIELASSKATNSQEDYVSLFFQSIKETAPSVPLSTYFAHKDNKEFVSFNSSNEEVESFIRQQAEMAVENSFEVLRSRIDRFGVSQPIIQKLGNSGRIMVELPGISDPERARKLLQASAQLEFWKTYLPGESINFISNMNKALKARNDLSSTLDTTANAAAEEPILGSTEEVAAEDTTTQSDLIAAADANADSNNSLTDLLNTQDSSANDSTKAPGQMTQEEIQKEYPLIRYIAGFNLDDKGMPNASAEVGFVSVFDTVALNKLLNDPELANVIPGDVRWAYHYKPGETGSFVGLYALRAERTNGGPSLEGDVITDARSQIGNKGFEVTMYMNTEGRNAWKKITAEASKKQPQGCVAIVLDGVVYSAPTVNGEIPNGVSSISGNFTQEDTKFLATILNSGKLPAPARIVEEAIVGPSLGKDAINSGLMSIIGGLVSVVLIMLIIYSGAGLVANLAVLLNLYFMIGVLASLQAALTLPGIAGIILTLGMAVDANVLIYERVKEELANGKNLRSAIANGYSNALSAILDGNITTLLTGIVLLIFGKGPIYGFSVTLIIGILSSLFTAILFTRLIFEWRLKGDKEIKFSIPATENLLKNVNIDFIGKRKMFYGISSVIIIAGLASIFTKGLDQGVDFKGGWSYVVTFEQPVTTADVRKALEVPFEGAPEVKIFGSNNSVKITTDFNINDQSETAGEKVEAQLKAGLTTLNNKFDIPSTSKVGPTIADDIKQSAVYSILVALILMFLYILVRFRKWQFATGTVVKLAHDVLIVLGLFSLLDGVVPFTLEIDQSFIAALLTVIGYSINDSVVVMDRVREYLTDSKNKKGMAGIINEALNSTLSRTMITSLTTLGVLVILFIFGGEIIRGFAFAMLVGVLVGSYSSICIGAPLAADLSKEKN